MFYTVLYNNSIQRNLKKQIRTTLIIESPNQEFRQPTINKTSTDQLNIGFLWHFHQPDYRDPGSGEFVLPWVRLHACHSYIDMLEMAAKYPHIGQMLNFTPVLLDQLKEYSFEEYQDMYLTFSRINPHDLSAIQRNFILNNFFQANLATQIFKYKRYHELYTRRERLRKRNPEHDIASQFSDRDIRDLQVWFNLTWMGWHARRLEPVESLLKKGRDFSEDDKEILFAIQKELIEEVLQRIKSVSRETVSELTFTPYYHPIIPILYDSDSAKVTRPDLPMPVVRFNWVEDAEWHVREGINKFEKITGQRPRGMWPSEGAVSREALAVFAREGIEWLVTDEGIANRSIPQPENSPDVHRPHRLTALPDGPSVFFRHHELSDSIGFRYQKISPEEAVKDFVGRLEAIRTNGFRSSEHIVIVALDGENPWGYYPDRGEGFLNALMQELDRNPRYLVTTASDFLGNNPPVRTIDQIHAGSWINSGFHIWIGDRYKNRAWDMLGDARMFVSQLGSRLNSMQNEKIMHHIHVAEGSDWFWWYGEPNHSHADDIFDQLFRGHIRQVYRLAESTAPQDLSQPIDGGSESVRLDSVAGYIKPPINGKITSYFKWLGAGTVDLSTEPDFISQTYPIKRIHIGYDEDNLLLRFDFQEPASDLLKPGSKVVIVFEEPERMEQTVFGSDADIHFQGQTACDDVLETSIPFRILGISPGDVLSFYIKLVGIASSEVDMCSRSVRFAIPEDTKNEPG